METRGGQKPPRGSGNETGLEAIAQRKLHYARAGQSVGVFAEGSGRIDGREYIRGIEAHGVCDVVDVPGERQGLAFREPPRLSDRHVDSKIARATQVVAVAGLSRKRKAERIDCGVLVLKY